MKKLAYILTLLALPFAAQAEEVKATPDDGAGGTVRMALADTRVALTPQPNAGYAFLQWLDGSTDNPRLVEIADIASSGTTGIAYQAVFVHQPSVSMPEGTVAVTIADPAVPSFALNVTPSSTETNFSSWNTGVTANNLLYTEALGHIYPRFSGLVSSRTNGAGGTVEYVVNGSDVALTPMPNAGYLFSQWLDGNTDNPRIVHLSDLGTVTNQAVFVYEPAVSSNNGEVAVAVNDPAVPSFTLSHTDCSSFAAFSSWTNGQTNPVFAYTEDMGLVAPRYRAADSTRVDAAGGWIDWEKADCGFVLTAVPNDGWHFKQWEDNSTSATRTVIPGPATYEATFEEGVPPYSVNGTDYMLAEEAMAAVEASAGAYPLVIAENTDDQLVVSSTMTIEGNGHTVGNLTVLNGGDLTLTSDLTVNNLYLNATRGSSSQLRGENYLSYTDAYIDITLIQGATEADEQLWYAFAVPFNVDIATGIRRATEPETACTSNVDYLIWAYDGQMRANNQDNGWSKQLSGTLAPGHFYMMGINGTCNVWRLHSASATLGGNASLNMAKYPSASPVDAGWNAMGNSTLTYATASVNSGIAIAQFYANGAATPRYDVINLAESGFVMASPFFIQVADDDQLSLAPLAAATALYAPARYRSETPDYYKLQLMQGEDQADVVYLSADENAENSYVIGKDVVKLIGGNTNPYLWVNAYGYRLCAQDAPVIDGVAEYALSMYAPQTADYSLVFGSSDAEATLWHNNTQVWNFANGGYALTLPKGTTNGYVLRIGTPRYMPTGMDEVPYGEVQCTKVLENGHLMIYMNNRVYDAQGKQVR